jgi:uncharacterized protein YjcR
MTKKKAIKPMHWTFMDAPRCGAKTRKGTPCKSPGMKNGRCRMHGGMSTGAPKGNKNAFKHGRYSAEAVTQRRAVRDLIRASKNQMKEF